MHNNRFLSRNAENAPVIKSEVVIYNRITTVRDKKNPIKSHRYNGFSMT